MVNELCGDCTLHLTAITPCVQGMGSVPCDVMVILESPAYSRERKEPVVINSGVQVMLRKFLSEAGMPDNAPVFYTNVVHCRTPTGEAPTPKQVKDCSQVTMAEIKRVNPKYVLLMGSSALKGVLKKGNITQIHGQVFDVDGVKYLPTFHPLVVERDPSKAGLLRADLRKFVNMVQGKVQEEHKLNMFVLSPDNMDVMLQDLGGKPAVSFDVETTHLNMYRPNEKILMLGIGDLDSQWIVPLGWPTCSWSDDIELQKSLLESIIETIKGKKIIGHNGKFDNKYLQAKYGLRFPLTFDTMLASHVLDETVKKGLKYQAHLFFNAPDYDIKESEKTGDADFKKVATYCAWDVYFTTKLYQKYKVELLKDENAGPLNVFVNLMMPASDALEVVEANGVYLDLPKYEKVGNEIRAKVTDLESQLKKYADINWNSSQQVGKYFFSSVAEGGLGLNPIEMTPTGRAAVGDSVLKQLHGKHPSIDLKLEYTKYTKQLSAFIEGWEEFIMPDSRMHCTFNLAGTETGRLSCSDPNLQQVPRDGAIRNLITAPEGWTLVECDYSQIELRIAAMIANEKEMLKIFNEGKTDIHTATAKIVTGKTEVSKEERFRAKAVNFGFLYGMGAKTFKEYAFTDYQQTITLEQAQEFRDKFFAAYPGLTAWHNRARDEVHLYQSVKTMTGRIRHLLDIMSPDFSKASGAERQAINTPVQSLASDIALCSLVELSKVLNPEEARIVGSVHDALLFEIRNDKIEELVPKIQEVMADPKILKEKFGIKLTVPILAEAKISNKGWGSE